jgi:hypothetical protein
MICWQIFLKAEEVPLLAGQVLSAPGNCCAAMNPIINQLPSVVPTAHVISSADCGEQDNAHFDSEGYRKLGKRYAVKMLSLMGYTVLVDGIDVVNLQGYALKQNIPNPVAGGKSKISFELPQRTFVSLKILDSEGVVIKELAGKEFDKGEHTVIFSPEKDLPAGIYFYKIEAGEFSETRKMVISKQ